MRIESFEIEGLLGREPTIEGTLDSDLAILTGRNGAGKTSVLKVLWSIVSGNILIGLNEVVFKRARIVTSAYDCTVHRLGPRNCAVDFSIEGETFRFEDQKDDDDFDIRDAEDFANERLMNIGSSVFFPTFRRLEGGFSTTKRRISANAQNALARQARARNDLEEALQSLSRTLTNESHVFVSAISTSDIVNLLLRQYANLSEESSRRQARTSQEIIQTIQTIKNEPTGPESTSERLNTATGIIENVLSRIETMEADRKQIMAPLDEVRRLVEQLFKHTGIKIDARMKFGDAANAVDSDQLSAGEKQMLSFVCYNAFYRDSIIFIDEPELSLHPDWQRQLFAILQRQQSTNQFVVATHSPFIYAKYPDKEIGVTTDRGDTAEEEA
jgi:predicted ATPase